MEHPTYPLALLDIWTAWYSRKMSRGLYLLVVTQTISLIGSRMTSVAVGIWVYQLTGEAASLLLAAFFNELPGMLGNSLAGVLVDRWDRRRVMILADMGQALATSLLLISFFLGAFEVWQLYAVSLLAGTFAMFQQPATQAAVTMLVPEQHRERINGIREMSYNLAGVIAPALAGVIYSLAGVSGVIAVDLASFGIALLALALFRIPKPSDTEEGLSAKGGFFAEAAGGLRFIARRPSLLLFLFHIIFMNFMLNGPLELAIPYLVSVTGNEAMMGVILGMMSGGALCGALLVAAWKIRQPRMYTILQGGILVGAMFLVYGVARSPAVLAISIFFLMLPLPMGGALNVSILQIKTPPDMQGRIFAAVSQLGFLGSTTSFLITGPLVDRVLEPAVGRPAWQVFSPVVGSEPGAGMGLLLVATGLIILAETLLMWLLPLIREMEAVLPDYAAVTADEAV
jgi:MFS family permease